MKIVESMEKAPHACTNCKRGARAGIEVCTVHAVGKPWTVYLCHDCVAELVDATGRTSEAERRVAELEGQVAIGMEIAEEHDRLLMAVKETLKAGAIQPGTSQARLRQKRGHKAPTV